MPKIFMAPGPFSYRRNRPSNGIQRVVEEVSKRLVPLGWEFVRSEQEADITAGHACTLERPDVVHCHGLHPTAELRSFPNWFWEVNRRVIGAVKTAKAVTVPSLWVAELFEHDMNFRPVVIRHGIDLDDWPPRSKTKNRRKTVLWNKNRDFGVCDTGTVEKLAERHPKVQFVSTLGRAADNLRITGLVRLEEMKRLLRKDCDVFLADTKETFGIGTLEAMASGCPVLGWNWGHTPQLARHEIEGYMAEPGDIEDTSVGLDYCLDNMERLSESARERAGLFDWDSVVQQYDALYRRVLGLDDQPLVSFVIPCYNYEKYVSQAIESVKLQSGTWECIVVDDGSVDGSLEMMKRSAGSDSRFRIVSQENSGVAAARDKGAMLAEGKYLCFLDADDYLRPNFLALLLPHLEADSALGLVYGRLEIDNGEQVFKGPWPGEFNPASQVARQNQVPSCNLMRRSEFLRTGGFRQRLAPTEDAELWARMTLLGCSMKKVTDESVYVYRVHGPSASRKGRPEPDWISWLSGANGGPQPFASLLPPRFLSHPVRNYDRPEVSIVTPVGDGHEKLIADAIDSVAAQTFPYWEMIVVDNTTEGKLKKFGSFPYESAFPFVKWLRCETPNASKARNTGASAARGEYLCFLDADDVLLKDFLAATLPAARETQGMVYTDWVELPSGQPHVAEPWDPLKIFERALFGITFLHPKSAWEAVGGFDEEIGGWEDWDYEIALTAQCLEGVRVPGTMWGYRYNTGTRREEHFANRSHILPKFWEKWRKEREEMACNGCGGRKRSSNNPRRSRAQPEGPVQMSLPEPEPGLVEVEFTGPADGALLYKCPSGNRYRFGGGRHRRKLVRDEDAEFFQKRPNFRVKVRPKAPQIPPKPEPEPEPAAKPEIGLDIPGVSQPLLKLLNEAGFDIDRLRGASPEDLLEVEGIGPRTAKRILDAVGAKSD